MTENMKRLFLVLAIVVLPLISKAQYYDMGPGSAMWMYQQQQAWNAQMQYWNSCNQAYMQQAAQFIQEQNQNLWRQTFNTSYEIPTTPITVETSVTTNSSNVVNHSSHREQCSNCGGKGYIEKLMYFGSSQGNKTVRIDCGACVRGWVRK
jgi:hypothetical protein